MWTLRDAFNDEYQNALYTPVMSLNKILPEKTLFLELRHKVEIFKQLIHYNADDCLFNIYGKYKKMENTQRKTLLGKLNETFMFIVFHKTAFRYSFRFEDRITEVYEHIADIVDEDFSFLPEDIKLFFEHFVTQYKLVQQPVEVQVSKNTSFPSPQKFYNVNEIAQINAVNENAIQFTMKLGNEIVGYGVLVHNTTQTELIATIDIKFSEPEVIGMQLFSQIVEQYVDKPVLSFNKGLATLARNTTDFCLTAIHEEGKPQSVVMMVFVEDGINKGSE